MDTPKSFRGERCGIDNCRSRRYHLSDEGYACEQGHIHPDIPVRGEDEDDFGPKGAVTRSSSASTTRENVSKHFTGRKGFELYLQCYQLVLWKQCYFLIHAKGYPSELEDTVRDLWTLRIQHLKNRIDDINTADSESEGQSQAFSSQSEDDELQIGASGSSRASSSPRIVETLGLLYLAATLLRLSVLPADLFHLAGEGQLLYYGALRATPADMRARLPGTYHESLEPRTPLTYDILGRAIKNVAFFFYKDVGMKIPPLNFPPLCLRCVQELALPLPVYAAVAELRKMLEYQMMYEDWDPATGGRLTQASYPAAQLASLLVIVTKLLYPFEDSQRAPSPAGGFSALSVNWDTWSKTMREPGPSLISDENEDEAEILAEVRHTKMSYSDAMNTTESDVTNMSPKQLDEYLQWYAVNWTSEAIDPTNKEADFRRDLFDMFPMPTFPPAEQPTQDVQHDATTERLKTVVAAMVPMEPSSGMQNGGQGLSDVYYKWRTEADLNPRAREFCEAVVKVVGIPLDRLVRAVFFTERRLRRWCEQQRREQKARNT